MYGAIGAIIATKSVTRSLIITDINKEQNYLFQLSNRLDNKPD